MSNRSIPCRAGFLSCILLTSHLCAAGEPSIDLPEARRYFAEVRDRSITDGGRLWGVEMNGPILFVDPSSRMIVANQPDASGLLTEQDGLFVGALPEEENIANTAFDWAGVTWTMLMWPLPKKPYDRTRLLTHECFHRVQPRLNLPMSNPNNGHLDSKDGRTWLRLEWRALAEALIQQEERRHGAVEDALVFRAYRHSLLPEGIDEERALELNEGLAEYTGFRLCGLPDGVLADRAAIKIEDGESADSFTRSFAYLSGPAYGILLDEAGADWRGDLSEASDLGNLLAAAYRVEIPSTLQTEALRRAERYDGPTLIAEEIAREDAYHAWLAEAQRRYFDDPVLILPLGEGVRYSFNPRGVTTYSETAIVYEPSRVTDRWGILEASGGVLLSRDATGRASEARVPAPANSTGAKIEGDGWTLTLAEGWSLAPGPRENDYVLTPDP